MTDRPIADLIRQLLPLVIDGSELKMALLQLLDVVSFLELPEERDRQIRQLHRLLHQHRSAASEVYGFSQEAFETGVRKVWNDFFGLDNRKGSEPC